VEEQEILRELMEAKKGVAHGAIEVVEKTQMTERPQMQAGDTVKVHVKVREGDKERIQVFEGIIIGMHRGGVRASFTVRKVSFGQGVERIFPLHSPVIQKVEVVRLGESPPREALLPPRSEGQGGADARGGK
jgi:large subunit ribosomal protein L19